MIPSIKFSTKVAKFPNGFRLKKNKNVNRAMLPLVATPIVYYNTQSDLRKRTIKKIEEISKTKKVVTETEEVNLKALKKLGIPEHQRNQYLNSNGEINDIKIKEKLENKKIPFKGENSTQYPTANINEGEYITEAPKIYDDSADVAELEALDKSISIADKSINTLERYIDNPFSVSDTEIADLQKMADALETIIDNPLLIGLAAEMIPLARFLKPCADLMKGDIEKSGIGVVTRVADIGLFPVKAVFAVTKGLSDAIIASAFKEKDMGFFKGIKEFWQDWARGRDEIEDEILGRKTKTEIQKENLEKLKKKKKELELTKQRKIEEHKRKRDDFNRIQQEKQQKAVERDIDLKLSIPKSYDKILDYKRQVFENTLKKLKEVKPYADISKYDNYKKWNSERLEKNTKMIEREIISEKLKNNDNHQSKQNIKFENLRNYFVQLLNDYKFYKPNADTSNFTNWEKWNYQKLEKNTNLLKRYVEKAKRNINNK